jgi:Mitochondrial K+-H+ exchange-related
MGGILTEQETNQMAGVIVDAGMDVYLLPVGRDRYELYCEVPDEPEAPPEAEPSKGMFQRLWQKFSDVLAEAERERRRGAGAHRLDQGWMARTKTRMMRWVAESIAEQRLLWHMRRQTEARLFFPDDLAETTAMAQLRSQLTRDRDKHRFWLSIDSVGFVLSGLLVLVPGPNVVAYYFAFRLVGHYLSMMGARRGLEVVHWHTEKSAPLSELRRAIELEPELRARQVSDVALKLRLEHLATFFERIALTAL